ncbi:MAG: hypothetical protein QXF26_09910 [Candidatus Bathyarchaeia archaeon]
MNKERTHRKANTKMAVAYFTSLFALQALGIIYALQHPYLSSIIFVGVLVFLAPIVLEAILEKILKSST